MSPFSTATAPEAIRVSCRYWLRADGLAFEVSDHLHSAQYAQAESDESDRPVPWGYQDMFRHGWIRLHVEPNRLWADGDSKRQPTAEQARWMEAALAALTTKEGAPAVRSALQFAAQSNTDTLVPNAPTQTFLQRMGITIQHTE